MKKKSFINFSIIVFSMATLLLNSCVKDKDYEYNQVYGNILASLKFTYSIDSLPADGGSKSVITIEVLPENKKDSINITAIGLTITTSNGTFAESSSSTISLTPTYKLDTVTNTKILTATATLQSSTRVDTAKLTIKYAGVQQTKLINFYRAYPNKIKLSASSLRVAPNFVVEDTLISQLSGTTGLPSQGTPISMRAFDSVYSRELGIFRINATKTNALGNGTYIYVLGDSLFNKVNYIGTLHLVGYSSNNGQPISDTITIYSRN